MERKEASIGRLLIGILFPVLFFALTGLVQAEGSWQSDLVTGCKVWNSAPRPNESFSWRGDCKDGFLDGSGILYWIVDGKLGIQEEVSYIQGRKHGKGLVTWPTGERYEGDYYDGLKHGKGIFTWPNGDRYEGDWIDDNRTGKGIFSWANGDRYEGDFSDNMMSGYGEYKFADGQLLRGRFENNKYVGP